MTKILVIDDDRDAADSVALLFEAMGHEVEVAYEGDRALPMAEASVPHIIFLDLKMPGTNGFQAAMAIRASPSTDHPFLVAVTGLLDAHIERATKAAGFDLYVAKPADFSVLLMIVDHLKGRDHQSKPV